MNVEEREAFWQFWVSTKGIDEIPIVAAEMGFAAGMAHRDKRVAELEAAAIAYRDLATCYRLKRNPSESLFKRLEAADAILQAAEAARRK